MLKQSKKTYYEVLKISKTANDSDVRKAYVTLANLYHPDKNPENRDLAESRFRQVSEAYAALKTRDLRVRYNRKLHLMDIASKTVELDIVNDNDDKQQGFWTDLFGFFSPLKSHKPNGEAASR